MMRNFVRGLSAVLVIAFYNGPLAALTINANFISEGYEIPGIGNAGARAMDTSGTGNLADIFGAAANAWERVIHDDFTLTINYGWYSTEPISSTAYHQQLTAGGTPGRQLSGSIAFNSHGAGFFLDPTPYINEEFGMLSTASIDLGAGPLVAKRERQATSAAVFGRVDLLSSAIHEIGHALGLTMWDFYFNETSDGDIDVSLPGFTGTSIPVTDTHIDVDGPALSNLGRPLGYRREISQVDLLAVCQVSGFQKCSVLSGDYDFNGIVEAADIGVWKQTFGSTTELGADGNHDGIVDAADYTIWRDQLDVASSEFGLVAPRYTLVPEPKSRCLMLCAAAGLAFLSRVGQRWQVGDA